MRQITAWSWQTMKGRKGNHRRKNIYGSSVLGDRGKTSITPSHEEALSKSKTAVP